MSTGRSADRPPSRPSAAEPGELGHRPAQVVVVVDDLHRPAAEHVARAHEHRVADALGDRRAPRRASVAVPPGGLRDLEPGAQRVPALAVLGEVDRRRRWCRARAPAGSRPASFSGVWPPSDTITPTQLAAALLGVDDVEHVLVR